MDGRGAAVVRVSTRRDGGCADGAVAAKRRHTHRGACAKEGEGRFHRLADDTGAAGAGAASGGGFGRGLARKGLRDLEEGHAELEEGAVQQAIFFGGQIALGFFCEDAQHVDALACAQDIDLRLLALVGRCAKLHHRRHIEGLYELLEAHRGRMVNAGVGGANRGVEAVCRHLVRAAGLVVLLRRSVRAAFQVRPELQELRWPGVAARRLRVRRELMRALLSRAKDRRRGAARRPW